MKLSHYITQILAVSAALCFAVPKAFPQLTMTGVGSFVGGMAAYSGPGDAVSGASMWWGLRGYNAAFSGSVANICDSATGLVCADATWSGSTLTLPTISALPCDNTVNICVVKILYDQTGNANDATNASGLLAWPILVVNCLGAKPCMSTGGRSLAGPSYTRAIPYSMAWVGARVSGFTTGTQAIRTSTKSGGTDTGWAAVADTVSFGAVTLGSVTDVNFHAVQGIGDTTTTLAADGVSTTGGASTNILSTPTFGGSGAAQLTEGGIWPLGFNAQNVADLNSNAHSYWGF